MVLPLIGIFFVLHGLVHLLYFSISQGWIIDESIGWSMDSWLLSGILHPSGIKIIASISFAIIIILFLISGILVLVDSDYWIQSILISTIFSSFIFLIFWDGHLSKLPDQGIIGILINVAIIIFIQVKFNI